MSGDSLGRIPLFMDPWLQNNNPIWLGTQIQLARNIEKFLFPNLLKLEQQKQIYTLLSNLLIHMKEFEKGVLTRGDESSPFDREYLIEHFFLPVNQLQGTPGTGYLLNEQGSILACFNLENHLMLYGIEKEGQLEKVYRALIQCEEAIQKNLGYAFSNRFGYLTSHPELAGTGLKVKAFLQLSALIHTKDLDPLLDQEKKEGIEVFPLFKEKQGWSLDIAVVENRYCLGITEEGIINGVRHFTEKLLEKEQKKRMELQAKPTNELKDKISRACAIIKHSYQIDVKETMQALSLLKLGLALGWITGTDLASLNELFFRIRRAHLMKSSGESMNQETLLHRRAEYLQNKLASLSCHF